MASSRFYDEAGLDDYLNEVRDIAQGHGHAANDIADEEPVSTPESEGHSLCCVIHWNDVNLFVGYAHRALDVYKCLCCTEGEKEAAWMRGVGLEEVAAAYESELSSVHVVVLINVVSINC